MQMRRSLIFAALVCSALTFGQLVPTNAPAITDAYQIGYAANLNLGDSVLNLSNAGVYGPTESGNICVNVFVFDPSEEQIACCACLVSPDGLDSLSVKQDLISNSLTAAIPNSVIIKLVASMPGIDVTGNPTICNPAGIVTLSPAFATVVNLASGMRAWGTTMEPNASPGTFGVVSVHYEPSALSLKEVTQLNRTCAFIQAVGSNFGVCNACQLGSLAGAKQ
jgi:hypothetical protein